MRVRGEGPLVISAGKRGNMELKKDCRHFLGFEPCRFHKLEGCLCENCSHYEPEGERILIIKLGGAGDVLRTTCILPALREKYPQASITWVTLPSFGPLLGANEYVDRTLLLDASSLSILQVEEFDRSINLDASLEGGALATAVRASEKRGFGMDAKGELYALNPEAEEWLRMGIEDERKRANRKTYQEIALGIAGLSPGKFPIIVRLREEEKEFARDFARRQGLEGNRPVIGLNTGAGSHWERKKWTREEHLRLVKLLAEKMNPRMLLFGGPGERERNRILREGSPVPIIDTGCDNSLRQFLALLGLCDLVVTTDTLALHAALGLGKKVVTLFGPTSPWEVELYGRGRKVVPDLDCVCCYQRRCDRRPGCMEMITAEMVLGACEELVDSG